MTDTDTVVVTGAARGIGAAIAGRFASAGWDCVLVDMDPRVQDTAERLRDQGGLAARAVVADITSEAGRVEIATSTAGRKFRALVNNAGITRDALLTKMTAEQLDRVVDVNLLATINLTAALVPRMKWGAVVNVSSKSANGNVGQYNYAVSKSALVGYTRSLAVELAPRVRVNAIAPAFIATEMTAAIPDKVRDGLISRIPFGRAGEPDEVAETVYWLVSPGAAYITGQVLAVCGGRSFAP